jgi:hypothetical protein
MPLPIKPIREQEEHNELFGRKDDEALGLSPLQQMFLGSESTKTAAKQKYGEHTLTLLEQIYGSVDTLSNAASEFANPHREASVLYKVPSEISDNDLLNLKAQGLVLGSGRSVKLTDNARIALRDKWLVEPNNFKENRSKDRFDFRTSSAKLKFKKISSTEG